MDDATGMAAGAPLSERQRREFEYHRERARAHEHVLTDPFSWDVLQNPARRWWNAYWQMYACLLDCGVRDKRVLVVGCGFGDDALRLAKLGARVSAFDLSPDSLRIARELAVREGLSIAFDEMPAEAMRYADASFDLVVARDILHHVDIPAAMREIARVARPGAIFVVDEIYSHSWTERIRRSPPVEKFIYPCMRRLIYGPGTPYITADERKLDEADLAEIMKPLQACLSEHYFNFLVTRLVPDRFDFCAKADCLLLRLLKPLAPLLAGRVLFVARFAK